MTVNEKSPRIAGGVRMFGFATAVVLMLMTSASADTAIALSRGQTVYVPVYSHVYAGDREQPIFLAATLSIRNTDIRNPVTITKADYYDSDGRMIKSYIQKPVKLNPMSATRFVIKESDKIGGSGANFIVQWSADQAVNPPLIESVMISTRSALGISFNSRGQVIQDHSKQ